MKKPLKKFWFYKNQELCDITKDLEGILNLPEYCHDYEDTWEWCESFEKNTESYFDISREHNDGRGKFESPVILIMNRVENYKQAEIDLIGKVLVDKLNVEVYWGFIDWDRQSVNDYTPVYHYDTLKAYYI